MGDKWGGEDMLLHTHTILNETRPLNNKHLLPFVHLLPITVTSGLHPPHFMSLKFKDHMPGHVYCMAL